MKAVMAEHSLLFRRWWDGVWQGLPGCMRVIGVSDSWYMMGIVLEMAGLWPHLMRDVPALEGRSSRTHQ